MPPDPGPDAVARSAADPGEPTELSSAGPSRPADRIAAARAAAVARAAALEVQVAALAEQQALTTHDDEHDPEGVTIGYERAQLLGLLGGARDEIAALDRAADRLREGGYGRCAHCGAVIPEVRLEALPAADTCLACADLRHGRRRRH
ncbi:TraR/DksA family transcriptional regulator [Pseudonocardia sp. RS11V-5]|uniref:TraR/DksA family transcriptional regulator n=1 Tax=Pseudonocardia terrae TaxID=2905831 RepID=UPI001E4A5A16|nr:TraR/DksA family transcriptional regulator [Pseudonocardia terrae]MCE3554896.1 TraR/DksA family transcriptional regulator [Pseudonocardia terrae]